MKNKEEKKEPIKCEKCKCLLFQEDAHKVHVIACDYYPMLNFYSFYTGDSSKPKVIKQFDEFYCQADKPESELEIRSWGEKLMFKGYKNLEEIAPKEKEESNS